MESPLDNNPLAKIPPLDFTLAKKLAQPDFGFLPSLLLLHGVSPKCQGDNREGDYLLGEVNLGANVEMYVVGIRHHALKLVNNQKDEESFNPNSPIFKSIEHTYEPPDRTVVCFCGNDFLLYLPQVERFCTFFPGRKTAKLCALEILSYLEDPSTREKAKQNLAQTNHFTLSSQKRAWGPRFRALLPTVTPLPADPLPVAQDLLQEAQNLFYQPVQAELAVEENVSLGR